jgi:transcriptional regulator with XRE-family HTH domain
MDVTAVTESQLRINNINHSQRNEKARERCIYPNLKLRIYTTGMRQNLLAKLVGVNEGYLSRIVNGVRVPGQDTRLQIAKVLGCDAEWLFEQFTVEANRRTVPESTKVE